MKVKEYVRKYFETIGILGVSKKVKAIFVAFIVAFGIGANLLLTVNVGDKFFYRTITPWLCIDGWCECLVGILMTILVVRSIPTTKENFVFDIPDIK